MLKHRNVCYLEIVFIIPLFFIIFSMGSNNCVLYFIILQRHISRLKFFYKDKVELYIISFWRKHWKATSLGVLIDNFYNFLNYSILGPLKNICSIPDCNFRWFERKANRGDGRTIHISTLKCSTINHYLLPGLSRQILSNEMKNLPAKYRTSLSVHKIPIYRLPETEQLKFIQN